MPNSMLSPSPISEPGIIVAGDAFNMRHPLTGGGMTVALRDVVRLRDIFSSVPFESLSDQTVLSAKLQEFHYSRSASSAVINVLACALYRLFQSENGIVLLVCELTAVRSQSSATSRGVFRVLQVGWHLHRRASGVSVGVSSSDGGY